MVEFDRRTARYRLGLKVFRLGSIVAKSMELVKQADPLLQAIAEETNETLVPGGRRRERSALPAALRWRPPGAGALPRGRASARPSTVGRLSECFSPICPIAQWEEVVAAHVRRMTQYSLLTPGELERDRREIRERGYSVGWEDVTLHACALGAPVRDATGEVVAAVSISGIVQRFSAERLPGLIRSVMELGDELSRRLGLPAPGPDRRVSLARSRSVGLLRADSAAPRALEQVSDLAEEAGRRGSVEDAMVGRQRQRDHAPLDHAGPAEDGSRHDRPDPKDGRLGRDDRAGRRPPLPNAARLVMVNVAPA